MYFPNYVPQNTTVPHDVLKYSLWGGVEFCGLIILGTLHTTLVFGRIYSNAYQVKVLRNATIKRKAHILKPTRQQ